MSITDKLLHLGLSEKESAAYVALVELGSATAAKVAEKSGLKRPTTYTVLEELRKRGLANKIPHVKKQIYSAKDPRELVEETEVKLDAVRRVMPELLALAGTGVQKTFYFDGLTGVKEAMNFRLIEMSNREFVGFYATGETASPELLKLFRRWSKKASANGVKIRGIVPKHPTMSPWRELDADEGREMKQVPYEEYSANISIDIGDTFVRIVAFKELQATIVENKDVADTMRQIFEMVWRSR